MAGLADGRIALVTGGASGIGREAAVLFAEEGAAAVLVADLRRDGAEETAELVRGLGAQAEAMVVDVADEDAVAAMVARCVSRFGGLHCAFNNAGMAGPPGRTGDWERADWQRLVDVMLTGTWLCCKHELRHMAANGGGAIVNTASVAGVVATPGMVAYTAAKHGVVGLTKAAALEYVNDNIRVNAICPGATMSRLMRDTAGAIPGMIEAIEAAQPGRRMSDPREQAQAAVWLCSDRASFVNGVAMLTDNGATAGGTSNFVRD
jgi:NAD(P)-dependent dehydrogenase (short-subunit alcohol dehydrogenase family)